MQIGPAVASFCLSLLAIVALRPVAVAVKWVDRPGGHKNHQGEVPLVGGLAMHIGIVFGLGFVPLDVVTSGTFLAASVLLVVVGLLDDRFGISPWTRLPVQIAAAVLLVAGTGASVVTFGAPFGGNEVTLSGFVSQAFTVVAIVAAINAFNMLDGVDGLAGAMAVVALAGIVALGVGQGTVDIVSLVALGAVAAFLLANVPVSFNRGVRCFMGDGGSTLLGFIVVWRVIELSQSSASLTVAPATVLWVVALPLYEVVWSTVRRAVRGISPLAPDCGHLHHVVLRAGFGVRGTLAVFAVTATLLATVGIVVEHLGVPDRWSFALFALMGVIVVSFSYRMHLLLRLLPRPVQLRVQSSPPEAAAAPLEP